MAKIYIVGMGPGSSGDLTAAALERINSADKHYLRTDKHPTIIYFQENQIAYKSYDYLYEEEEEFDQIYEKIVEDLIVEAEKEGIINYYVPGNPLVAEKTVELLLKEDIQTEIISGMSFIEPLIEMVERDPIDGLKILDGSDLKASSLDINIDIIITQVYNWRLISNLKILASEIYGDEHHVYFIQSAGVKGQEKMKKLPLYQLDRIEEIDHLTSIYLPRVDKKVNSRFDMKDLIDIMLILRGEDGCPWDMAQTHKSIREGLIEEAYEVVDAIDSEDVDNLIEELGDLLLQIIFHSQIAEDEGDFNLHNVTTALVEKLIYRHPHVFSKEKNKDIETAEEVKYSWDQLKISQRGYKTVSQDLQSIGKLPGLLRSYKIQKKAAAVGFDWDKIDGTIEKIEEEFHEVMAETRKEPMDKEALEEEVGDLFFALVNFARFLEINPELALNKANNKFIDRFSQMEALVAKDNKRIEDLNLAEMDKLWEKVKLKKKYL